MRFIFEKMDLDRNGILTPDEIKSAFILLGIGKEIDKVVLINIPWLMF